MTRIQRIESMMEKRPGLASDSKPTKGGITRLLAAHTASVLADRLIQMVALGAAMAAGSKAAALSAWILFWATIPGILLAPVAGKAVDRVSRGRLMMFTDAARAFFALGLMGLLSLTAKPSALYAGVALVAAAACFFTPARLALVPNLVKKEALFKVNAWFACSAMVMTLAGTGIGSLMIHTFGTTWTLAIAALMYLTSAVLLSTLAAAEGSRTTNPSWRVAEPREKLGSSERLDLWEGFRAIRRHRAVRRLVVLTAAISMIEAWFYVGVAKLATERLHLDILGFGGLLTALGAGLVVGALLTHRQRQTTAGLQMRWLAGSLGVIGASSAILSIVSSFGLAAAVMALLGIGTAMCLTASDTLFQRAVPDRLRGRIFAARGLLAGIAFAACVAVAGWTAPVFGIMGWFLAVAAAAGWIAADVWLAANDLNLPYLALRWILRPVAWWYCRVRRTGLERIPLTGPVLVAPNHPSRMDAALMVAYSPRRLYFLAAETNWNLWWLGPICTRMGCVPVSKTHGNSNAIHTAARLLKQGKAVCIFPEGQINKEVGALKPGVAILAAATGVPIVPVGFNGTHQAMPLGQPLRRHPVSMAVGEPICIRKVRLDRVPDEVIERINEELSGAIRRLAGQGVFWRPWELEEEPVESAVYGY
ncbi:MAG: MFS transporter [Candidatus Omnitrophica bacterium]|nr:MFS transporter [Candidatus Omnitrophota bacterium]